MHTRYVRGFPFHSTPGYSRAVPAGTQKIRTFDFLPSWMALGVLAVQILPIRAGNQIVNAAGSGLL